jgi:hypothetical protein
MPGVISSRRFGNMRLVSVADSPLTGPLTELLLQVIWSSSGCR